MSDDGLTPEEALQADVPAAPEAASAMPELTFSGAAPGEAEVSAAPRIVRGKIDKYGVAIGTGRRKTAVARVRLRAGTGKFEVNGRPFDEYFRIVRDQEHVQAPLHLTDTRKSVDVWVRVEGGGTTGQAGAVVLGISRALDARSPELHTALATHGFLTRDDRMVERKKYGHRKARRSFQFSKR